MEESCTFSLGLHQSSTKKSCVKLNYSSYNNYACRPYYKENCFPFYSEVYIVALHVQAGYFRMVEIIVHFV